MPLTKHKNYVSFINNGFSEEEALRGLMRSNGFQVQEECLAKRSIIQRRFKRYNAEGQYNNNWSNFT
jgi:iron complex outermembrane receptor protein